MNKARNFGSFTLLAALCAVPIGGLASPCAGTNINNTVTWGPSEIVKGNTLSIVRFTSVIVSDDPSAPLHLASGECVGSFLMVAEGKTSASGYCSRKDKDGDALNEEWITSGGGVGTSKLVGGTGKFAKTTGSWKWQHNPLHGTTAVVRWTGDCR